MLGNNGQNSTGSSQTTSMAEIIQVLAQQQQMIQSLLQQQQQTILAPTSTSSARNGNVDVPLFEPNQDDDYFGQWLKRFEYISEVNAPGMSDSEKVKCLVAKLSNDAFNEYLNYCMPKEPTAFSFDETKEKMQALFSKQQTIFIERFNAMRVQRQSDEDYSKYFNRIKAMLKRFKFKDVTEDQFGCLIALSGLPRPEDESIRTHMLQRLNTETDIKFENIIKDVLTIAATKTEQTIIEERQPSSPCYRCGEMHWHRDCKLADNVCNLCHRKGHDESKCFKKSKRRQQ